jgi:hypothetical protein
VREPHHKYREVFSSTLLPAAWHCAKGLNASAWVDFVGSRSLAAGGTPVFAADGQNFRGRPVAKLASGAYYRGTGLTQVAASASRPHVIAVLRDTLANYANGFYYDLGVTGVSDDMKLTCTGTAIVAQNGTVAGPLVADTLAHRMEFLYDASASTLVIDSTTYTGSSGSVAHAITTVGIGVAASAAVQTGSVNVAGLFVFSQALTASQLAIFRQFCLQDFGL